MQASAHASGSAAHAGYTHSGAGYRCNAWPASSGRRFFAAAGAGRSGTPALEPAQRDTLRAIVRAVPRVPVWYEVGTFRRKQTDGTALATLRAHLLVFAATDPCSGGGYADLSDDESDLIYDPRTDPDTLPARTQSLFPPRPWFAPGLDMAGIQRTPDPAFSTSYDAAPQTYTGTAHLRFFSSSSEPDGLVLFQGDACSGIHPVLSGDGNDVYEPEQRSGYLSVAPDCVGAPARPWAEAADVKRGAVATAQTRDPKFWRH